MNARTAWEHTVEQRRVLRDLLAGMTPEQGRLVWETLRARGDVRTVSFADAKRRSAAGPERILADSDWTYGAGEIVEGPVLELLMLAAGRSPDLSTERSAA